jgi:8-oxo-dGTP diphosphatase
MAGTPVLAAGGIVVRRDAGPLIAVVRLRKRNEWVLPKGKLEAGESDLAAARREVLEETGHQVVVHEFLGTLAYASGGRTKIVQFWRMEAEPAPSRALMRDIKAVAWLPLDDAVARLSRNYEQAFLSHVGPLALGAGHAGSAVSEPPVVSDAPTLAPDSVASRPVYKTVLHRVWRWLQARPGRD